MPENLISAFKLAKGEYVAILHDGDVYRRDLLERWVTTLDSCPDAGFVFNAYEGLDARGHVRTTYREALAPCQSGEVLVERVFFRRWRFDSPVWGTTMMRRSVYDAVGGLDRQFGPFADVDLRLRIAESYSVGYVEEALIALPSREALPRLFQLKPGEEEGIVERIFLEARRRHFASRPVRRAAELVRHSLFVACSRAFQLVLRARRAVHHPREKAGDG
jgi:hypothetical protein